MRIMRSRLLFFSGGVEPMVGDRLIDSFHKNQNRFI